MRMKEIIIVDDLSPEVVAMLQALYSRSPRSVKEHLVKVKESGAEKIHGELLCRLRAQVIGDCGTASIFVENVSMLVAKAVQDWPLYSGQEASTRYLDMAAQEVLNPLENPEGKEIQDAWMAFYRQALEELVPVLKERFPLKEGEKEAMYEKAIKARSFDIARGFLPAGVTTYAAWHTNLRQAYDHIKEMRNHPLAEVREVAGMIHAELKAKYPFELLAQGVSRRGGIHSREHEGIRLLRRCLDHRLLIPVSPRHGGPRPPRETARRSPCQGRASSANATVRKHHLLIPLDFGSYRDLQRHRSCVQEMPLLSTKHGFYDWYLEQLPEGLRARAVELIKAQEERIAKLDAGDEVKQYYVAMGYTVVVKMTCPLPAAVYTAELRSSDTVHPTLRLQAQRMGEALKSAVPGLAMHHDMSPGTWNIKRGLQDIVKRD
jgi:thymidylate synthase ThyX